MQAWGKDQTEIIHLLIKCLNKEFFSGLYVRAFGLNMEKYRPEKTPYFLGSNCRFTHYVFIRRESVSLYKPYFNEIRVMTLKYYFKFQTQVS